MPCQSGLVKIRVIALALVVASACGTESETTVAPADTSAPSSTTVTTTAVPTTTVEDSGEAENWEEIEEDLRSGLVEILIERGMTPEEAEIEATQKMAEGVDPRIIEDQFALWENWLNNYPSHPVLGGHWTEADAECVIFAMWRDRGVHETDTQFKEATQGGMAREDAEFLVRPVANCVDLRAAVLADMVMHAYHEDPECLLAEVTEEQIASWYVADFTDGRDGFRELYLQDINSSC